MQGDSPVIPPTVPDIVISGGFSSGSVPTSALSSAVHAGNGESPTLAVLRAARVVQTRIQQQQRKIWSHRGPIDSPSTVCSPGGLNCSSGSSDSIIMVDLRDEEQNPTVASPRTLRTRTNRQVVQVSLADDVDDGPHRRVSGTTPQRSLISVMERRLAWEQHQRASMESSPGHSRPPPHVPAVPPVEPAIGSSFQGDDGFEAPAWSDWTPQRLADAESEVIQLQSRQSREIAGLEATIKAQEDLIASLTSQLSTVKSQCAQQRISLVESETLLEESAQLQRQLKATIAELQLKAAAAPGRKFDCVAGVQTDAVPLDVISARECVSVPGSDSSFTTPVASAEGQSDFERRLAILMKLLYTAEKRLAVAELRLPEQLMQRVRLRSKQAVVSIPCDNSSVSGLGRCRLEELLKQTFPHASVAPEQPVQLTSVSPSRVESSNEVLRRRVADMALDLQVQTAVQRQLEEELVAMRRKLRESTSL